MRELYFEAYSVGTIIMKVYEFNGIDRPEKFEVETFSSKEDIFLFILRLQHAMEKAGLLRENSGSLFKQYSQFVKAKENEELLRKNIKVQIEGRKKAALSKLTKEEQALLGIAT